MESSGEDFRGVSEYRIYVTPLFASSNEACMWLTRLTSAHVPFSGRSVLEPRQAVDDCGATGRSSLRTCNHDLGCSRVELPVIFLDTIRGGCRIDRLSRLVLIIKA